MLFGLLGDKVEKKSSIIVPWGLPDPLIADYEQAVEAINSGAVDSNIVEGKCFPETLVRLKGEVTNGIIKGDPSATNSDGKVLFTVFRNSKLAEA